MKARLTVLFFVLLVAVSAAACSVASHEEITRIGGPLDPSKVSAIEPGLTTFSNILDLLGPPDFIVTGKRQIMDEESFFATFRGSPKTRPISTRQITAPPGTVILIYVQIESIRKHHGFLAPSLWLPTVVGADELYHYIVRDNKARANELFIYLSKKDQTVIAIAHGAP